MVRHIALGLVSAAALCALAPIAEAQTRRETVITVRPRSFLDAGRVVPVGSLNRYATTGVQSYLNTPPYVGQRERFGEGVLPDPYTNGPFPGARNPFGPVDYVAPAGLR